MSETIRTADGEVIPVGGYAYFYYATPLDDTAVVKFKRIEGIERSQAHPVTGDIIPQQVWGLWTHIDGTGIILADESRVCSLNHARKMGWLTWSDDRIGRTAIIEQDAAERAAKEAK